jgi:hypothetical protein
MGLPALPDITPTQLENYFAILATSGRKRYSAMMAGIDPGRLVYHINNDKALKAREQGSMQEYCELIDAAFHERGINGVERGVYFKGKRIATERYYSDALLIAMAKANNPKYRDHMTVDANVAAGVLVVQTSLDPDDWEKKYVGMRTDKGGTDSKSKKSVKATVKDGS